MDRNLAFITLEHFKYGAKAMGRAVFDYSFPSMPGRLNAFQLSMLQWNDLHPYNAVHVVRIPDVLDLGRLKSVITKTLGGKGLTGLELDPRAGTFQYSGEPGPVEIRLLGAGAELSPGFAEEIECQLNTPFAQTARFSPFRFFALSDMDGFSLGLVYFHPVADAESIVYLLKDMVEAYQGKGESGPASMVELYPARRDSLLRYHPGTLARKLASLPLSVRNMRKTYRPYDRDAGDGTNKFMCFSLNPRTLSAMIQVAKSQRITLNDLFLAVLMKAVSLLAPDRARAGRRRNLSLGCIVNSRRHLGVEGRRGFGLFLGSFVVYHEVPKGIKLAELAQDIGRQTLAIKRSRLFLGTAMELTFGRLMMGLFSKQRKRKLYPKHYPLWGGLTNINLNALWPQPEGGRPADYFRAVSTGPVTPLVASITTIGPVANIGLTYRSTVFGTAEIERVKACFLNPLELPVCP